MTDTKKPDLYWHYKGGMYEVVTDKARMEFDLRPVVVYRDVVRGYEYVRPLAEFMARFHKMETPPLQWSKDLPSTPGLYLQRAPGFETTLMNVHTIRTLGVDVGHAEFCEASAVERRSLYRLNPRSNQDRGYQWYGPIPA